MMETSEEARAMENVDVRLRHMDDLGIEVQVLYPTVFISLVTDKVDEEVAICRGWNRWMADICKQGEGRLRWTCVLPLLDMNVALEELRFCGQHGAVGVFCGRLKARACFTTPTSIPSTRR